MALELSNPDDGPYLIAWIHDEYSRGLFDTEEFMRRLAKLQDELPDAIHRCNLRIFEKELNSE